MEEVKTIVKFEKSVGKRKETKTPDAFCIVRATATF